MKRIKSFLALGAAALVAASVLSAGCSSKSNSVLNETVATVNGDSISVMEVREAIGIPGGIVAASIDKDQKKKVVDQIAEARLLAQEARSMGIDNTPEFKAAIKAGEPGIIIKGLFRKELEAKGKKTDSEIDAAAKDLVGKDKALKPADARARAVQTVFEKKLGEIQAELVAAARKAFPEKIETAVLARVAKGENLPDDTVVGQVGSEKMTYGEARALISKATQGSQHAGKDFTRDEKALASVISQDLSNRSVLAYAKQQGGDKGQWVGHDRLLVENSILIGLLAEKTIFKNVSVSDKEIEATYKEHKDMFNRDGKVLALSEVRGQIVTFLQDDKKRKAIVSYLAPLKAKAKIAVTDSVLAKI